MPPDVRAVPHDHAAPQRRSNVAQAPISCPLSSGPLALAAQRSAELVEKLLDACSADCLSVPDVSPHPASPLTTKCTLGLMLNDLTIHGMVVGGPAFKSRQIFVGDRVVRVDGRAVGLHDYEKLLVGNDQPDSEVILTVYREAEGMERDISLRRMPREQMADHVKMFELFTRLGGLAVDSGNEEISESLQDAVRQWTKMQVHYRGNLLQMCSLRKLGHLQHIDF